MDNFYRIYNVEKFLSSLDVIRGIFWNYFEGEYHNTVIWQNCLPEINVSARGSADWAFCVLTKS